jgi:hypothetical protein
MTLETHVNGRYVKVALRCGDILYRLEIILRVSRPSLLREEELKVRGHYTCWSMHMIRLHSCLYCIKGETHDRSHFFIFKIYSKLVVAEGRRDSR